MSNCFTITPVSAMLRCIAIAVTLFATSVVHEARSQDLAVAGNKYVTASVISDNSSNFGGGRFVIDAGPSLGDYRFLYYITSFVVFRVTSATDTAYYTNAKDAFGGQPLIDGVNAIPFRAFDSIYQSADTVAVTWRRMSGFEVTMRLIPEKPKTQFDNGSDILIEFSYAHINGSAPSQLGIQMMLDTYNGQASGASGGSGDKASILTSRGYFPTTGPGRYFDAATEPVPDFYHVGNFLYETPLNDILPVHRLRGLSHNGAPLTTPELFAIGDWHVLRNVGWAFTATDVTARNVGDGATIVRWSGLHDAGTIRTAFGSDNRGGNDLFHCRDGKIFVDIRTDRSVVALNGADVYTEKKFDVTLWATNTDVAADTVTITLADPIGGATAAGRIALDSASASQTVALAPHETRLLRWRLKTMPGFNDASLNVPLDFKYSYTSAPGREFKAACTPSISVRNALPPVRTDTMPPVIIRTDSTVDNWKFRISDEHSGYPFDTGLDTIIVDIGVNALLDRYPYVHCDPTFTGAFDIRVIDPARHAHMAVTLLDCRGNAVRDTVVYEPLSGVTPGVDEPGGFAIVAVHPQPLAAGDELELTVRNPGGRELVGELVAVDGSVAANFRIEAGAGAIVHAGVKLPERLAAGVYFVRLKNTPGAVSVYRVIIE